MARILNRLVGHREKLAPLLKAQAESRLASTLLFAGPPGIGKRMAALALAQTLICEKGGEEACGECGACLRVEKEQSESLLEVSPDGAHIKIEQARDILQYLTLRKIGRARVVLIDQAHLFNPQAGNALLKSLEEPPQGTHFILISSLAAGILPTIRSRSQLVRFRPLTRDELAKILGPDADDWVLDSAQGSIEIAKRLLENREDIQALEAATDAYLAMAIVRFPSSEITSLKDLTKDRSFQALFFARVQAILRDAMILKGRAQGVVSGESFLERLGACDFERLDLLSQAALRSENDLARNVERGLVLENFALELRKAVSP